MSAAHSILIVDADADFATTLAAQLALDPAFSPRTAASVADALHLLGTEPADAIVLAGDAVSAEESRDALHEAGCDAPVLTLLSKDEIVTDDAMLVKPVRMAQLLPKLRRLMRRTDRDETIALGPYVFRPMAKTLGLPDGTVLRLTEKETAILLYLHRAGDAVARETLLAEVWGYNPRVTTHTLETHIYRLRQKLEAHPSDARLLVTETGGYRLMV
ncbi:MAG: response regulator transcription factor [Beijerinckiaceae bacterium]|nr:response regulator transcription factor [Beijerinckiaceae bacterium]